MFVSSKRYGYKIQSYKPKNSKDIIYYACFKVKGRMIRKKIGRKSEGVTEKKAFEIRNSMLSELKHGVDITQNEKITLKELAGIYFENYRLYNTSNEKTKLFFNKHIAPILGDLPIIAIKDKDVRNLQEEKLNLGLSQGSIDQIVKLIKRLINFAVRKGIIPYSPLKDIKLFNPDNKRLRYLTKREIDILLESVKEDEIANLFTLIALSTGARAESILLIQKKDIDFERGSIIVKDLKRNNRYVVYLNETAKEAVYKKAQNLGLNDYIVSKSGEKISYSTLYKKMQKHFEQFNSGLEKEDRKSKVVLHTLRHTFASHLAIKGVPIQDIQCLLNHQDIKMTLRYAKLAPESSKVYISNLYKS